jgi:SAM-dependent methyltransferase
VWQRRDLNAPIHLVLTAYYLMAGEAAPYLHLGEDDLFGAYTVRVAESLVVSRDLLDSVNEMWFLDRALGLRSAHDFTILDIGSGYGRMAHRLVSACPEIAQVLCVDAIPESTFLCEYYLRFRRVDSRARAVPFPDIEEALKRQRIDLAVNVHSFSECTLQSIRWWLDLVRKHRVKHLMVVPNAEKSGGTRLFSLEQDGSRLDFGPEIASRGYRLVLREPKYRDSTVQQFGVSPSHYFLFELA